MAAPSVKKLSETNLFFQPENGILSEEQLEAFLLGWFYRATRTCDRRGGTGIVTEEGAKDPSAQLDPVTGLPNSANALLPKYRATFGPELAMSLVIPPEAWVQTLVYTDDLAENANRAHENREWRALAYKAKEQWSEEEILAVKENTRRLKRVVHRLSEAGLFVTKPVVDEDQTTLGTKNLTHGQDNMTMGFQLTYDGLRYAEEFAKLHPKFMNGHTLLDAMGETLSQRAPQWLKQDLRNQALLVGGTA